MHVVNGLYVIHWSPGIVIPGAIHFLHKVVPVRSLVLPCGTALEPLLIGAARDQGGFFFMKRNFPDGANHGNMKSTIHGEKSCIWEKFDVSGQGVTVSTTHEEVINA